MPIDHVKSDCPTCMRQRERQQVITVRMPESLHRRLKEAAHERQQSLNQLCLESLGVCVSLHEDARAETP